MQTFLIISNIILWICMIAVLICFFFLSRMVGEFLNRFRVTDGKVTSLSVKIGQIAPFFRGVDQRGEIVKLSQQQEQISVLIFKNSTCATCSNILQHLREFEIRDPRLRLVLIDGEAEGRPTGDFPEGIHLLHSADIFKSYYIDAVPTVVIVDQQGQILVVEQALNFNHLLGLVNSQLQKVS